MCAAVLGDAELDKYGNDQVLTDYEAISIVYSLEKYANHHKFSFENLNCLIELRYSSNMRFLKEDPAPLALHSASHRERRTPQINLADGKVYVRGMLDALLVRLCEKSVSR